MRALNTEPFRDIGMMITAVHGLLVVGCSRIHTPSSQHSFVCSIGSLTFVLFSDSSNDKPMSLIAALPLRFCKPCTVRGLDLMVGDAKKLGRRRRMRRLVEGQSKGRVEE